MIENESFSQVGGARFDFFNATWPFVKINVSANAIELKCFSKKYRLEKDQIIDLREYTGMISKGLLIEHKLLLGMLFLNQPECQKSYHISCTLGCVMASVQAPAGSETIRDYGPPYHYRLPIDA